MGHFTNLAVRTEQLTTPGPLVVSSSIHRLTDSYFSFKDLAPTQIKGVEEPLNIYEVQGLGQVRTRSQVSASRDGRTRFVEGTVNLLFILTRQVDMIPGYGKTSNVTSFFDNC